MKPRAAFVRAMRRARGLPVPLRCVAFELACSADETGTGTTTTRAIADALEVTERTAERWLVDLTKAGWFERSGRKAWRLRIPDRRVGNQPDATIGIGASDPDAGVGTSGASRAPLPFRSPPNSKTNTNIRQGGGVGEGDDPPPVGEKRKAEFDSSDLGRALAGGEASAGAAEIAAALRIDVPKGLVAVSAPAPKRQSETG